MKSHMTHRSTRPPPAPSAPSAHGLSASLSALRTALESAERFAQMVSDGLAVASSRTATVEERLGLLEHRVLEVEADSAALATRLVNAEQQAARLMNLYVATYQLHATLDPVEVRATIGEIATSLLGAERFALLLRPDPNSACDLALAEGLDEGDRALFANGRYVGADALIDAALSDGTLRIGRAHGSRALAVVPLVVQDNTVGALVILELFAHRGGLSADDRELLDLLAAHAASALFVAQVHAAADRKLHTLESLVRLARKG